MDDEKIPTNEERLRAAEDELRQWQQIVIVLGACLVALVVSLAAVILRNL